MELCTIQILVDFDSSVLHVYAPSSIMSDHIKHLSFKISSLYSPYFTSLEASIF